MSLPDTMKAMVTMGHGDLDQMVLHENWPRPDPAAVHCLDAARRAAARPIRCKRSCRSIIYFYLQRRSSMFKVCFLSFEFPGSTTFLTKASNI